MHRLLPYKNSQVSWYRFGTGRKQVLCFHGYGEDARSFAFLDTPQLADYSFICIDLPYHGNTAWNEGLEFSTEDLIAIINGVTDIREPLQLMGFSLGGRVALSLYELIPDRISKLILLAPDGLKVNRWYWFATQTMLGNRLFRFTMKHPAWFFFFVKMMKHAGLINNSVYRFVTHYIDDPAARRVLYERWTALRKLKPDLKKIKEFVRARATPVRIVYGRHDRIILPVVGDRFRKGIERECIISTIQSGHQVLHAKHLKELIDACFK